MVLNPGESGGEAPARQCLEDVDEGREVNLDATALGLGRQAIETLCGKQIEMTSRNDSSSVDLKGRRKQHVLRDRVSPLHHARHPDNATLAWVLASGRGN